MICPACQKGQMIKTNPVSLKKKQATKIQCVHCGHSLQYHQIKAA